MEYSLADIRAATEGEKRDNVWGDNAFLWVILIFLFFLGFSGGNGLFGNRGNNGLVDAAALSAFSGFKNNDLSQVERDVLMGNCATQKEVLENRYQNALQTQTLSSQLCNCCCEINRNIDGVEYNMAKNTCDIINAIHADGEQTRALINANTMQELRDSLQAAQLQLGQISQTQTLLSQINKVPVPAYLACSPYMSNYLACNGFNCNGCGNCGC